MSHWTLCYFLDHLIDCWPHYLLGIIRLEQGLQKAGQLYLQNMPHTLPDILYSGLFPHIGNQFPQISAVSHLTADNPYSNDKQKERYGSATRTCRIYAWFYCILCHISHERWLRAKFQVRSNANSIHKILVSWAWPTQLQDHIHILKPRFSAHT